MSKLSLKGSTFDLSLLTLQDARVLSGIVKKCKGAGDEDSEALYAKAEDFYKEGLKRLQQRILNLPEIIYPEDLPVMAKHDEIVRAVKEHQVVIIAGQTGSGKTTQIPKMCLEAGCGTRGMIGHTQPRRIAARAVASRIASELLQSLGQSIGYKVRFSDTISDNTVIKLMTDGILLAETASDRLLLNYDCIIIDEAHERSLNIDFLTGYLKNLLKARKDLKVIITSATIDPKRFSKHFNNAPVIEVSGRSYPVEIVYMPLERTLDDEQIELDLAEGVLEAFLFLQRHGMGDTLVFLPGEREIMDLAAFLRKAGLKGTEIIPLYARLTASEQNKIFEPHTGVRIILTTNIAETSLTVPFIRYVIDPGTARISRYSARTKVQRLPVEPISKASANQRAGRCGRVSSGICVRLYSKEDYDLRPDFTDPEILRTSLASVILQMISLNLGDIGNFPFMDPPKDKQITDGMRLLHELGAIDTVKTKDGMVLKLTRIGHYLAALKADPRLSRMIVEASSLGSLNEVLIIASGLAVIDPRERPFDKKEQAQSLHGRFNDERSDFLSYLNLYHYITGLQKELSGSALRKRLKKEFISYLKVREWFDVLRQLRAAAKALGFVSNGEDASYEAIHRAVLAGVLSQMGQLDTSGRSYTGARGIKFIIHPGSSLAKKSPKWICAHELSETTRLFARNTAKIDPAWAEIPAGDLCRRHYHDIHWSKKRGEVNALVNVSLYGLTIVSDRKCSYSRIDPKLCRELLIREGLVHGEINSSLPFLRHNLDLTQKVEELENRLRRKDLLADDTVLEEFYDKRLPADMVTVKALEHWWKRKSKTDPNFLDFTMEDITKAAEEPLKTELYPQKWQHKNITFSISYTFLPGDELDGASLHIPIAVINQVNSEEFTWQIPGLRLELVTALIRSLPKKLRRNFVPAPEFAKAVLEALTPYEGDLFAEVCKRLTKISGEIVSVADFDLTQIPKYLFLNFVIEDLSGKPLATGRNFKALCQGLEGRAKEVLQDVAAGELKFKEVSSSWTFGTIEKKLAIKKGNLDIIAFPALSVREGGVQLELFDHAHRQEHAMLEAEVKLLLMSVKAPVSYLEAHLPNRAKLAMYYQPLGSIQDLIGDLTKAAVLQIIAREGGPVWDQRSYEKLLYKVKSDINDTVLDTAKITEQILIRVHELKRMLKGKATLETAYCLSELSSWIDNLIYKGFIADTLPDHLKEIPRYLQAGIERVNRMARDINRDRLYAAKLISLEDRLNGLKTRYPSDLIPDDLKELKWMLEELRVSYFAQNLGVPCQISEKRILNELERIIKEYPPLH